MNLDALVALGTLASAGAQIGTGVAAQSAANKQARSARQQAALAAEDERRKGRRVDRISRDITHIFHGCSGPENHREPPRQDFY